MSEEFSPHGTDLFGNSANVDHGSSLGERFILPPFSVLNARDGWWQERKRAWLALGIKSELGRRQLNSSSSHPATTSTLDFYVQKRRFEAELGREISTEECRQRLAEMGILVDDRAANKAATTLYSASCEKFRYPNGKRGA